MPRDVVVLPAMSGSVHRFVHHVNRFSALRCTTRKIFSATLCGVKGYGRLIAEARRARGKEPKELAKAIGQSASTYRRLESEETEPSVEQINALVSNLPLSAEELLTAMGLRLSLPVISKVPYQLAERIARMSREQQEGLIRFLADYDANRTVPR